MGMFTLVFEGKSYFDHWGFSQQPFVSRAMPTSSRRCIKITDTTGTTSRGALHPCPRALQRQRHTRCGASRTRHHRPVNSRTNYPATNADLGMRVRPLHLKTSSATIGPTLWLLLIAVDACPPHRLCQHRQPSSPVPSRASANSPCASHSAPDLVASFASALPKARSSAFAGGATRCRACRNRHLDHSWHSGPAVFHAPTKFTSTGAFCFLLLAFSLFSGLIFGLAPALRVPIRNLEHALRVGGRTIAGSSRRLHAVFVVAEIALAFVLLASAGLLGRTLLKLSSLDPGLNTHSLLTARFALSPASLTTPAQMRAAWQSVFNPNCAVPPAFNPPALSDIIPMRDGENVSSYSPTPARESIRRHFFRTRLHRHTRLSRSHQHSAALRPFLYRRRQTRQRTQSSSSTRISRATPSGPRTPSVNSLLCAKSQQPQRGAHPHCRHRRSRPPLGPCWRRSIAHSRSDLLSLCPSARSPYAFLFYDHVGRRSHQRRSLRDDCPTPLLNCVAEPATKCSTTYRTMDQLVAASLDSQRFLL